MLPISVSTTNSNTRKKPAGRGIEGIITGIAKQLAVIEQGIDDVYYGNRLKNTGVKIPGTQEKVYGILAVVQEVQKIDLCNILNYVASNTNIGNIVNRDTNIGRKVKNLQTKAKQLIVDIDNGQISNKFIKDPDKLAKVYKTLSELSNEIDNDVVATIPQLANSKNYLDDVIGSITQYTPNSVKYVDLNTVPNADIQRLLNKIRGVQSVMYSITTIQTAQDLISLTNNVTNLNVANQVAQLQKVINPAQLLPVFKQIARTLRGINQILLKLLGYIKIIQVLNKVLSTLLKVLTIINRILELIPIPNMLTTTSITQKLSAALQKIKRTIEDTTKRVREITALVELLYSFIVGVLAKVNELIVAVDIIIYNLQACEITSDSIVISELQSAKGLVLSTISRLNTFTANYATSQADKSGKQRTYNGYTLRIQEEELVDRGIKYKRRKGIALDTRGVLVAETQLTFATDIEIIYQELLLILQNKGLIVDTSLAGEISGINQDSTEVPFSDKETYQSIGLENEEDLIATSADIQVEISDFIKGIKKGGNRFKKRIQQRLTAFATQSAQELKDNIKTGNYTGNVPSTSGFTSSLTSTLTKSTGTDTTNIKVLSPEVRAKWESVLRSKDTSKVLKDKARQILNEDDEARQE